MTEEDSPPARDASGEIACRERRRIAFFVHALNGGGAQQVTINLVNGLVARDWDVDVVMAHREGELIDQLDGEVNIVSLDAPHVPVVGVGAALPALIRYLRAERPSVLFSVMTYVSVIAIPATILAGDGTAVVPTEHTTFGIQSHPKERLVSRLASILYPFADRVVSVSEGVSESVIAGTRVSREQVSVINNPVVTPALPTKAAVEPEHPWTDGEHDLVLSAGRIEPEKDYETLLRAFERLYRSRPALRLVVLGEGSLRAELQRLARTLGIEDLVSFPGFVDNPYSFMRRSDVYVLSSRREGLPTALIEAMACGCPVVATDCPSGPREILENGRLGPLVPVGDDAALADAIGAVLADSPGADKLRDRAEAFSYEAVLEEYEILLDQLINPTTAPQRETLQ